MDARATVIAVAPNGARMQKSDHPGLPVTQNEIIADARKCWEQGARMLHLHIRDREGRHLLDADAYRRCVDALRHAIPKLVVQITTESAGRYALPEQLQLLQTLQPEFCSIALREFLASEAMQELTLPFFSTAVKRGIGIQYILYSETDIHRYCNLLDRGDLCPDDPVLLVLGNRQCDAQPSDLHVLLAGINNRDCKWMTCAFGQREADCMQITASTGGHCRLGFENNLRLADGSFAKNNAQLVAELAGTLPLVGRMPASYADTHTWLSR